MNDFKFSKLVDNLENSVFANLIIGDCFEFATQILAMTINDLQSNSM